MTDRQLLEVALCALLNYPQTEGKAIEAIRTRLAQPEPEPVAWSYDNKFNWDSWGDGTWQISISQHQERADQIPLYTAPPKKEWVGLTDEEVWQMSQFNCGTRGEFARAIEAKLKEKNNDDTNS